jgi:transcriptional regulator with XRE-family HTH domain
MPRKATPPAKATTTPVKRASAVTFGRRVRALRLEMGWSQMQLAVEAGGMHFTFVSQVERGVRNISLENICRLAAALAVDPSELVAGLKPQFPVTPLRGGKRG